jgi:hypothetical protein
MRDWMDARTHAGQIYFATSRFGLHWSGFGEPKPYLRAYRRPLSDILNALIESGWLLDRFVEPQPLTEMQISAERLHAGSSQAPAFICVRERR